MSGLLKRAIALVCVAVIVASTVIADGRTAEAQVVIPEEISSALAAQGSAVALVELAGVGASADLSSQRASVSAAQDAALANLDGVRIVHRYETIPFVAVEVRSESAMADLIARPAIAGASLNTTFRLSDFDAGGAAGVAINGALDFAGPAIGADVMHKAGIVGSGVRVAVIDTGFDVTHPDLQNALVHARCFSVARICPNGSGLQSGDGAVFDGHGHGTAVAGVITGDGIVAGPGMAPASKIEAYRIFFEVPNDDPDPEPGDPETVWEAEGVDALKALDYINANRTDVDIINISFGLKSLFFGDFCDQSDDISVMAYAEVLWQLRQRGTLIVAATADDGLTDQVRVPACLSTVVSVTAASDAGALFSSANLNHRTTVGAPGLLEVPIPGARTALFQGTSLATPVVAGCAALFMQDGVTEEADLRARIKSSNRLVTGAPHSLPFIDCAPRCGTHSVTRVTAAGEDGTPGDDVILGTAGNDVINGFEGNDIVCAGGGDDVVRGDEGNDTLYGEAGKDRMWGGQGHDRMFGGDGDDTMHGNRGNDTMRGHGGNDRMFGYSEMDDMSGGDGNDVMHGNRGDDTMSGDGGDDVMWGYADDDSMSGGPGADRIVGNFGDDALFGDDGNDEMLGSDGADTLHGHNGNDNMFGNSGDDTLYGYSGTDRLNGGIGFDACRGNDGFDFATSCEDATGVP